LGISNKPFLIFSKIKYSLSFELKGVLPVVNLNNMHPSAHKSAGPSQIFYSKSSGETYSAVPTNVALFY
jgi:hypothetical protein